jgi:hypothetical protein
MMVDGAEEGQLKGLIDVLAPYTSRSSSARSVIAIATESGTVIAEAVFVW